MAVSGGSPARLYALPDPVEGGPLAIRLVDVETAMAGKQVLNGVTLDIPARRITVIVGLSGAGKSVILRHMIGLTRPDRGQVLVDGIDINRLSRKELYALRDRFGVMFQTGALFESMTVFDNVAFPLREKTDLGEEEIRKKVERLFGLVGLPGINEKYPDELSGGMVRRVALARAMVLDPEIIFFDEPTTGLDPIIRNSILRLVCDTWREHAFTMVMVSHDIPEVFNWCHHLVVVRDGKIAAAGPTASVLASEDPFVRQLLTGDFAGPIRLL
ncbi:MAG: ATP-binding cassette domain-containing protein [Deltaproteobacteria bacterium]|nr:ATP-binding cassette domain-containing protein [Deltaproteobacteria bacterium]